MEHIKWKLFLNSNYLEKIMETSIKNKINEINIKIIAYKLEVNSCYATNIPSIKKLLNVSEQILKLKIQRKELKVLQLRQQKIEKIINKLIR